MKRTILLLVVVIGGAFYLGWFTFTTDNSGQSEHVNIVIHKEKIKQDEARALEKLHAYEQQVESQAPSGQPGESTQQAARPSRQSSAPYEPAPTNGYSTYAPQSPTAGPQLPAAGNDPYELPEPPRSQQRPAAQTADSFSRGFQ